jgi:sugar/nucleoside kinase (ribokinase family)
MTAAFDLLVLGDANPDLVLSGGDVVPAFGQAEHLVEQARLTLGGSGAIVAAGAVRLGLRVAIAGVVGDDLFGREVRDQLEKRGVDTRGLVVDPTTRTGLSVILSGERDRAILTHLGSIATFRADRIAADLWMAARHVHVSSYFLQESLVPELGRLFAEAHTAGATTSIDPNWDPSERWDGGLLELLHLTDVFLPNDVEARRLAHTSDLDEAARSLAERARVVAVKVGPDGAVLGTAEETLHVPCQQVRSVDTTGAGDCFDAGFIAGWLEERTPEACARLANACGTLSTEALGGVDAQPTMAEAEAFLAEAVPS